MCWPWKRRVERWVRAPCGEVTSQQPQHTRSGATGAGESRDPAAAVGALTRRRHAPGPCVLGGRGWGRGLGASVHSEPPSTAGLEGGDHGLGASVHSEPPTTAGLEGGGRGLGASICSEPLSAAGLESGGRGLRACVCSEPLSTQSLHPLRASVHCRVGAVASEPACAWGCALQAPSQWTQPGFSPPHRRPVSGRSATCW